MTNTNPRISVIVPVYNAAQFLRTCIDSVLAQTFEDFELLLVDDGSSDESGTLCDEYAESDDRIRIHHQPNSGVSAARNHGLATARGEYVTFVDADDWVDDSLLAHLVGPTLEFDLDLVVSGLAWHYQDGRIGTSSLYDTRHARTPREIGEIVVELEKRALIHGCYQKLIRRSVLDKANIRFPPLSFGEDILFNLSYLPCVDSIYVVPDIDYHYRRNDGSTSISGQRRYEDVMAIYSGRRTSYGTMEIRFEIPPLKVFDAIADNSMHNHVTALTAAYSPRYILPKQERIEALRRFKSSTDYKHFSGNYHPSDPKQRILKMVLTAFPLFVADTSLKTLMWAKYRKTSQSPTASMH